MERERLTKDTEKLLAMANDYAGGNPFVLGNPFVSVCLRQLAESLHRQRQDLDAWAAARARAMAEPRPEPARVRGARRYAPRPCGVPGCTARVRLDLGEDRFPSSSEGGIQFDPASLARRRTKSMRGTRRSSSTRIPARSSSTPRSPSIRRCATGARSGGDDGAPGRPGRGGGLIPPPSCSSFLTSRQAGAAPAAAVLFRPPARPDPDPLYRFSHNRRRLVQGAAAVANPASATGRPGGVKTWRSTMSD